MADWLKRPYCAATDRDAVTHLWVRSHARDGARGKRLRRLLDVDEDFRAHLPGIQWVLDSAGTAVEVLVDPERAEGPAASVWGFAARESAPDSRHAGVLHYVALRQPILEGGWDLVAEMLQELLAPVLAQDGPIALTCEIPLLREPELKARGVGRTNRCYTDDTWWMRQWGARRQDGAAGTS